MLAPQPPSLRNMFVAAAFVGGSALAVAAAIPVFLIGAPLCAAGLIWRIR